MGFDQRRVQKPGQYNDDKRFLAESVNKFSKFFEPVSEPTSYSDSFPIRTSKTCQRTRLKNRRLQDSKTRLFRQNMCVATHRDGIIIFYYEFSPPCVFRSSVLVTLLLLYEALSQMSFEMDSLSKNGIPNVIYARNPVSFIGRYTRFEHGDKNVKKKKN